MQLQHSELESNRFKLNIFRTSLESIEPNILKKEITNNKCDVLIARISTEKREQFYKIDTLGFPFIQADTLVYYYTSLETYSPKPLRNSTIRFIEITNNQINSLDELVKTIFSDYKNHYSANPLLKSDLIEGYQEWAQSFSNEYSPAKKGWLAQLDNNIVGFATCQFSNDEAEGVLYGVHPDYSGMGIYGDLIRFTQTYAQKNNYKIMKVSTQENNYAVQKVWSREGFALKKAIATFHINSLVQYSNINGMKYPITTINNHSPIANKEIRAKLLNQLSNNYKKSDIVLVSQKLVMINDIIGEAEDANYEIVIPKFSESTELPFSLMKVFNKNKLCMLYYNYFKIE